MLSFEGRKQASPNTIIRSPKPSLQELKLLAFSTGININSSLRTAQVERLTNLRLTNLELAMMEKQNEPIRKQRLEEYARWREEHGLPPDVASSPPFTLTDVYKMFDPLYMQSINAEQAPPPKSEQPKLSLAEQIRRRKEYARWRNARGLPPDDPPSSTEPAADLSEFNLKQDEIKKLRDRAISDAHIARLAKLRRAQREAEKLEKLKERRQFEFIRWMVEVGRLTDQT